MFSATKKTDVEVAKGGAPTRLAAASGHSTETVVRANISEIKRVHVSQCADRDDGLSLGRDIMRRIALTSPRRVHGIPLTVILIGSANCITSSLSLEEAPDKGVEAGTPAPVSEPGIV